MEEYEIKGETAETEGLYINGINYSYSITKADYDKELLIIKLYDRNDNSNIYYSYEGNISKLKKDIKYIDFCESLDEIKTCLKDIFNKGNVNIEKNNDDLNIKLKFNFSGITKFSNIRLINSDKKREEKNDNLFIDILNFENIDNPMNKNDIEIKILNNEKPLEEFICPNCGEKFNFNSEEVDSIILSNNNIKDKLNEIESILENIIKKSLINDINNELEKINDKLNAINEDIIKNNERLKKLLDNSINNKDFKNENIISGILEINQIDININKNIALFNIDNINDIDVYLDKEKINVIKDSNKWTYNFQKEGYYKFEIVFNAKISNMKRFFYECSNIIFLDFSNFDTSNVNDMSGMFRRCTKLKEIKGLNNFITTKVKNMIGMFNECPELISLDLFNFDSSNVTNISFMFNNCIKLKEIKGLNNFNTSHVKYMTSMFQNCNEIEYLNLSNFDTSNVKNMSHMFEKCNNLKEINCSNFNTSNVKKMEFMFSECYKLEIINGINKFNTSKVETMNYMFNQCKDLEYLDLSHFNTTNVTNMSWMFNRCNSLKYLNLLNFTNNCETEDMFYFRRNKGCEFITNNKELLNLYNSTKYIDAKCIIY